MEQPFFQMRDDRTVIQVSMDRNLWIKILIGMVLGVTIGYILSPYGLGLLAKDVAFIASEWIALPGILFLGLIKMVIIPLVICSIILGIVEAGSLDRVKQLGFKIVPYFILTTTIAVTIGLTLATTINPGKVMDPGFVEKVMESASAPDEENRKTLENLTIPKRIANMIPDNPARASLQRDMLQIVIFAIFIGAALLTISANRAKPAIDLCVAGQSIVMTIIGWAMKIAPYAVFGLLADVTIRTGPEALTSVAVYMGTVIAGLFAMFCVYLIMIALFARRSPLHFLRKVREVQLLAFSTSSSAATMPFSMQAAEKRLNVHPEVSRFVIPLGATINMDGTALYQAIAAVFLCQVFGIDLTGGEMLMLLLTTIGASIGTPAMPGVGIVVLATILTGLGVPAAGIGLILGVDRILDMCRTTVNVTGDLTATVIMERWTRRPTSETAEGSEPATPSDKPA